MAPRPVRNHRLKESKAVEPAHAPKFFNKTVAAALLLVFASGASALIFQVIWVKQLSLVVGVDIYAITIAVSGFFAGLALGGYFFGTRAESTARPIQLYCILELAIALTGIVCSFLLAHSAWSFAWLENHLGMAAFVFPFILVAIPATLMGGTVPVLLRAIVTDRTPTSVIGGYLYAANTAGAVAGALLVPFYLIPQLGVFNSAVFAGGINAIVSLIAYSLDADVPTHTATAVNKTTARPAKFKLALWLYSIAGGIALGYELLWSQILVQWTSTRSFAFAVVLVVYLIGIMLGSALSAPTANNCRDPWTRFGFLIAAAGTIALLQVYLLGDWLTKLQASAAAFAFDVAGSESAAMLARFVVAAASILLLPTLLLGAAFPTAIKLTAGDRAGHDVGLVLAGNTLGGIVGTCLVGFFLVPTMGLERSLALLAIAATIIGAIAALAAGASSRAWLRWMTIVCAIASCGLGLGMSTDHLANHWAATHKGKLLFHRSGASGTVAVVEQGAGEKAFRRLYIQGVSNSGDSMTSLRYMRLQTLIPLLIHRGQPRSALVIGLGTGITAGATLSYSGLEERVCAELLPEVAQAVDMFHGNQEAGKDSRLQIKLIDGRREILRSKDAYDMITLEPPPPSAAGVVNLYSSDFYRLAASRLNTDGLLAQWLPLPTQTDSDTRSLVRSFLDVFPHATLWTTELHEMMLIGSMTPIELNTQEIASRFSQPSVSQSLKEIGVDSAAALLATYVCDRSGLVEYAGTSPAVTDDQPRIEYAAWVLKEDFPTTLIALLAHQSEPTLVNATGELIAAIQYQRQTLHTFYASGLAAYNKDVDLWQRDFNTALSRDPNNPYYRWFLSTTADSSEERR